MGFLGDVLDGVQYFGKMVLTIISPDASSLLNEQLKRDHATQLEEKRQALQRDLAALNMQQHREKLALEAELAACNRKLLWEIAQVQRQTALDVANVARQTALNVAHIARQTALDVAQLQHEHAQSLAEYNFMLDQWPLHMSPRQILGAHHQNEDLKARPLKIFIVPPLKSTDKTLQSADQFSIDEKVLVTDTRNFLEQFYPYESPNRPTRLLDGAWRKPELRGNAGLMIIHSMLKSESVLILEPDVIEDDLLLDVGYWGATQEEFLSFQIRTQMPLRKQIKAEERQSSEQRGGQGFDREDFKAVDRAFVNLLCFVTSWFTDAHHLIYAPLPQNVPPLLPQVLPTLLNDHHSRVVLQPHLAEYIAAYRSVFEALKQEQPDVVPILALQLAESLSLLPDKTPAREYLSYSLRSWLELRNISPIRENELLNQVIDTLSILDQDYINRLGNCLKALEDSNSLRVYAIEALHRRQLLDKKSRRDKGGPTVYGSY